jgi:hypothetical protein
VYTNREKGWRYSPSSWGGNLPYWANNNFGKARQTDRQPASSLAPRGNWTETPPNIILSRPTQKRETSIIHHRGYLHPRNQALNRSPCSFGESSVTESIDQYFRTSIEQGHANFVDDPGEIGTPWPDFHHGDLSFRLKQGDDGLEIGSVNDSTPHTPHASGALPRTDEYMVSTTSHERQGSAGWHIDSANVREVLRGNTKTYSVLSFACKMRETWNGDEVTPSDVQNQHPLPHGGLDRSKEDNSHGQNGLC